MDFSHEKARSFVEEMADVYGYVKDPQYLYDLLISDIRVNCPINALSRAMCESEHHAIYRMLITTPMQAAPHYRAYHTWDTDALFDFVSLKSNSNTKLGYDYQPGPKDLEFRNNLRSLIKLFIRDEVVLDNWEPFPGNTLVFGSNIPMLSVSARIPRHNECEFLVRYHLDKYGTQN